MAKKEKKNRQEGGKRGKKKGGEVTPSLFALGVKKERKKGQAPSTCRLFFESHRGKNKEGERGKGGKGVPSLLPFPSSRSGERGKEGGKKKIGPLQERGQKRRSGSPPLT